MTNDIQIIKLQQIIKYILIGIFITALFKVPYGFYQFARLVGTIGFAFLAYHEYENKSLIWAIIFGMIVILLNPLIKIAFSRDEWQIIDILLVIIISTNVFMKRKNSIAKEI